MAQLRLLVDAVMNTGVKVKFSLCYLIKHYAMKAYGGVDI
jgi:hypothetical protein